MGAHAQQQHLVGLPGAVHADVRQRCGGKQPAQSVERLGPDRLAVHEVRVAGGLGEALREPGLELGKRRAVGVEHPVHVTHVPGPHRRLEHLGVTVIAVVTGAEPAVVGHIACGLLEIRHQPAPLEHLGEHVRSLLAGQVHSAELCHRVVAILEEHAVVELLGAPQSHGGVDAGVPGHVQLAHELVEEQPPQALGRA